MPLSIAEQDKVGGAGSGTRKVYCRSHCAKCGLHFSSDKAFDAHRVGPMDERRCEHPWDLTTADGRPKLVPLSEDGTCKVYEHREGFGIAHPVTVWTTGDLERRRAGLNAL